MASQYYWEGGTAMLKRAEGSQRTKVLGAGFDLSSPEVAVMAKYA
jgi:hypothetical protein